ncbi:MAG TPA: carbon-nitrogen hydrolase family protein [Candidatus Angelobacter sp.]|nr:carbon-nitrogen hydrolase family protein [Candidatus Angelobacter sp.]
MNRPEMIRAAISQTAPVYLDKQASLERALAAMQDAAKKGAQILAFGETWLPGYPAWLDVCPEAALWNHEPTRQVFARLRQNSVAVSGPEMRALCQAAGDLKLTVVMGINERVDSGPGSGTLYNSLLTFTPDGRLGNCHRKLVPTYSERMVWGNGDGGGLNAVEASGVRVGGLICWEHWMPLARMAMHNSGEHIHVAVWPTAHDLHQLASRHYAFEGRCFVLAVGLMMPSSDLPQEFTATNGQAAWVERGGSAIIAPNARYIVEPVFEREELIVADLDLTEIDKESMTLDVTGHYARPDVFRFDLKSS